MSEVNSSPVSLPPGSYDYDALKSATDKAAKGSAKNYDTAVSKALEESNENVFKPVDTRETPGYVMKDVVNEALGVTETIQVYDPKAGEKAEEEAQAAIPAIVPTPRPAAAEAPAKE